MFVLMNESGSLSHALQETELTRQLLLRLPELIALDTFIADSDDSAKIDSCVTSNVARPEKEVTPRETITVEDSDPVQLGSVNRFRVVT